MVEPVKRAKKKLSPTSFQVATTESIWLAYGRTVIASVTLNAIKQKIA
jgi:hypothetical protein